MTFIKRFGRKITYQQMKSVAIKYYFKNFIMVKAE